MRAGIPYQQLRTLLDHLQRATTPHDGPPAPLILVRIARDGATLTLDAHGGGLSVAVDVDLGNVGAAGYAVVELDALDKAVAKVKPRRATADTMVVLSNTTEGFDVSIDRQTTSIAAYANVPIPARPVVGADHPLVLTAARTQIVDDIWSAGVAANENHEKLILRYVGFHRVPGDSLAISAFTEHRVHRVLSTPGDVAVDTHVHVKILERACLLLGVEPDETQAKNFLTGLVPGGDPVAVHMSADGRRMLFKAGPVTLALACGNPTGKAFPGAMVDKLIADATAQRGVKVKLNTLPTAVLALNAEAQLTAPDEPALLGIDPETMLIAMSLAAKGDRTQNWVETASLAGGRGLKNRHLAWIRPGYLADALSGVGADRAAMHVPADQAKPLVIDAGAFKAVITPVRVIKDDAPANPAAKEPVDDPQPTRNAGPVALGGRRTALALPPAPPPPPAAPIPMPAARPAEPLALPPGPTPAKPTRKRAPRKAAAKTAPAAAKATPPKPEGKTTTTAKRTRAPRKATPPKES